MLNLSPSRRRNNAPSITATANRPTPTMTKWSPPLRTIEEVTQLLKPDQGSRLDELKLCWREPRTQNDSVGLLNKRNIAGLEKALKKTPSRITRLSIGWKHGGNRKSLIQLLQMFVHQGIHQNPAFLGTLESIELVLFAWLPDSVLSQLISLYGPQLKTLTIQATRMKVKTPKSNNRPFKNVYQSVHAVEYLLQEESVAKLFANPELASSCKSLTSLSLIDCDILDDEVMILVRFLWQHLGRSGGHALQSLSLRSNRHMSPSSLQKLCQAPISHRLDLSLCDIKNNGAFAIARAMTPDTHNNNYNHSNRNHNWRLRHSVILKEINLSGNYQLDEHGFAALARVLPRQVEQWTMSYCDMNEHQTMAILDELAYQSVHIGNSSSSQKHQNSCSLQELTLQGAKINNPEACQAIRTILQVNRSLIKIRMDDPKYPNPMSIPNLQILVEGLKVNYGLQELHLDLHSMRRQEQLLFEEAKCNHARRVRDDMEFFLLLNRAGRRILQNDNQFEKEAWFQVLLKARLSARMDVLYWLVRNCATQLF